MTHLFYPNRCPACGLLLSEPLTPLCADCLGTLVPVAEPFVLTPLKQVYAAFWYRGRMVDLLHRMKFQNVLSGIGYIGAQMAKIVPSDFDVVCYVPSSVLRQRSRGYQHTRLLAGQVSHNLGIPLRSLLRRHRHAPSQFKMASPEARAENVRAAFSLRWRAKPHGQHILIVDDLCTTGATLRVCARALLESGARSVTALVMALGASGNAFHSVEITKKEW